MNRQRMIESKVRIVEIKQKILKAYQDAMITSGVYRDYRQHYSIPEIRLMALQVISDHILTKSMANVRNKRIKKERQELQVWRDKQAQGVDIYRAELMDMPS